FAADVRPEALFAADFFTVAFFPADFLADDFPAGGLFVAVLPAARFFVAALPALLPALLDFVFFTLFFPAALVVVPAARDAPADPFFFADPLRAVPFFADTFSTASATRARAGLVTSDFGCPAFDLACEA